MAKHGNWLNVAEFEFSAITRQCLAGRRSGEIDELTEELSAWSAHTDGKQRGVDWQLQVDEASPRPKRLYPEIKTG